MELHVVQGLMNPSGVQRWHDYGTVGTPTVFFDGANPVGGATDAEARYRAQIELRRATPPFVTIDAELTLDGGASTGSLAVEIEAIPGTPIPNPEECVVRAHVFEDDVYFCCGIGGRDMWDRVGRLVLEAGALQLEEGAARQSLVAGFTLDPSWDTANLQALVFVQRGVTGEVLNAARAAVVVTTAVDATTWGRIKALYRE